jgi:molybdopterin converting factor small subunit
LTWWFEPLSAYETFFQDKEIECDPCPSMRRELLCWLSERYGLCFHRRVFDGEDLGNSVLVVINGQDARHRAGLETRLAPADVISILPMMAGGNGRRLKK